MSGKEHRLFGEYENPSDELLTLMRRLDDARSVRANADNWRDARAMEVRRLRREAARMAQEMFRAF
jgi:hypothetical protein